MSAQQVMFWVIATASAYVVGSIPFGVIIGRIKGIDIRQHGSRNVGATNVGRVLGRRLGLLCFLLDTLKGAAPVVLAGLMANPVLLNRSLDAIPTLDLIAWLFVAAAVVAGHMASIFLRFRGGKGVATGFGAMLGMWPLLTGPAVLALIVWYTTLRLTKFVSLSSMMAAASLPVVCLLWSAPNELGREPLVDSMATMLRAWPLVAVTGLLAAAVVWKHRANIGRLRRGEEPRVTGSTRRGAIPLGERPDAPADSDSARRG
jgi:glycerol-3-phosphate acyltransferase PlsY